MLTAMRRRLVMGLLALILSLAIPNLSVHAETEPNDTPGQANPLGIGTVGDTAASLSTGSDVDWFQVTVIQDYWYVFETYNVSPLVDTRLILYDQDGSTQLA